MLIAQVLATFLGETHRLSAQEEPLGLRLELDGSNILMPTMFDPSELRSDVNGKVVRFLHEDGAEVEAGIPYIEVEAMKMVMPLLTTESGAISHTVSPGSIIEAGELLASLVRWRGANSHASHTYIPPSSCRIPRQSARSASCGCAHSMCAFRPRSDATS